MSKNDIKIYDDPPPDCPPDIPRAMKYLGCFSAPFAFGRTAKLHVWAADHHYSYSWVLLIDDVKPSPAHATYQLTQGDLEEMRSLVAQKRRIEDAGHMAEIIEEE